MVRRLLPMILSADLTVRWSLFLSSLVADPNQTVIEVHRTDYNCGVEHDQQLLRQVVLPKLSQEVHPLLGVLDDCVDIGFPLQVPGDCGSQKPEGFHNQHSTVEYGEGGQCWGAPPEVHCHLRGFKCVQL